MLSLGMLLGTKLSDIAKMHPWYLKTNPSSSWSSPKTTLLHRLHLLCDQIWDSMFFCAPRQARPQGYPQARPLASFTKV